MKVFEFVIVHRPSEKEKEPKIVSQPKVVLAKDERVAQMMAVKEIPEEYTAKLEEVEISIRPF